MSSTLSFEQLLNGASTTVVTIGCVVALAAVIVSTIIIRGLFSSSKNSNVSKLTSNKEKKNKDVNTKKQQVEAASNKKKANNNKTKKNVNATSTPLSKGATSSSGEVSQSEESEIETVAAVQPNNKVSKSGKITAEKSINSTVEVSKSANVAGGIKGKTEKQIVSDRNQNVDAAQNDAAKRKPQKTVETSVPTKQKAASKGDAINKVNTTNSNKKQSSMESSETISTSADPKIENEPEDEGQWVTQGGKQVNNRNRNKAKSETSNANNQESVPLSSQRATAPSSSSSSSSNRKITSEKRTTPTNNNPLPNNRSEAEIESSAPAQLPPPTPIQEPIELCHLLSVSENRYTVSDDWWKEALNKQQTFSVDDIGDWPESEKDEQYVLEVKQIIPVKNLNNGNKPALTEKDINVSENEMTSNYKNTKESDKLKSNDQVNSSSVITGEFNTKSQSKKKATHVRRLS